VRVVLSEDLGGPVPSARIDIVDNGPGVPADIKESIFEPLFTSKEGDGNELGLSIVKLIIKEHNGDVFEIGTPSQGAHFVVKLPLASRS
jgi:signal transduction histidine kinase